MELQAPDLCSANKPLSLVSGARPIAARRYRGYSNPQIAERHGQRAEYGGASRNQARYWSGPRRANRPGASATAKERTAVLRKWFDLNLMLCTRKVLARIMTAEQGKPLSQQARGEGRYAASFFRVVCEEAKAGLWRKTIPGTSRTNGLSLAERAVGVKPQPLRHGNFPAAMILPAKPLRHYAGSVVPWCSSRHRRTPFFCARASSSAAQAGLPAGLLSVVTADADNAIAVVQELCRNPIVRKLSFYRLTGVGIKLMEQCAPTLRSSRWRLGGKRAFIVFGTMRI